MTASTEVALDEAHDNAYVVEYAAAGHLYRINLTTGVKTAVSRLYRKPRWLLSSPRMQYATEISGRPRLAAFAGSTSVRAAQSGISANIASAAFFLVWGDPAGSSLLVAGRGPSTSSPASSLTTNSTATVASGFPLRPSAMTFLSPSRHLLRRNFALHRRFNAPSSPAGRSSWASASCPETSILRAAGPPQTQPIYRAARLLLPGKGNTFQRISAGYDQLPEAVTLGAIYYRILVDGVIRMDTRSDMVCEKRFPPLRPSASPFNR